MKNLITLLGLTVMLACNDVSVTPTYYDCANPIINDSSAQHPKDIEIQQLLESSVKKGIPGISLMLKTPDGHVWTGAAGKADLESKAPMQACQPMLVASVSKVFKGSR